MSKKKLSSYERDRARVEKLKAARTRARDAFYKRLQVVEAVILKLADDSRKTFPIRSDRNNNVTLEQQDLANLADAARYIRRVRDRRFA